MRGFAGSIAAFACVAVTGCAEVDDLDIAEEESALTIGASGVTVATAASLPVARAYRSLPATFDFVPDGCHFLAFISEARAPGEFITYGVCTRPRAVHWRVYGSVRGDWAAMNARIATQVASHRAELQAEAASSGAVVDFGTGGGGDFGTIGPKGGGPVGPGPGGPGGTDPLVADLFDEASAVEAEFRARATTATPVGCTATIGGACTAPVVGP